MISRAQDVSQTHNKFCIVGECERLINFKRALCQMKRKWDEDLASGQAASEKAEEEREPSKEPPLCQPGRNLE